MHVERTANSLYTLSLHDASPFCLKGLTFPLSQDCGVCFFFLPPYFSSSFTLPAAASLLIHEMQSQEREKERVGESKRETKTLEEIHRKGG